jgi:hypothetical protein
MPARGLGWKDRRELANGRDWNPWPAGRGWPDKGTEEAHGGRVSTAKGAAGGLDDVAKCNEPLREGRKTSDRPAKQPRASGRRDTCHCEPKRASRWRDGSGLCIPKLRLLIPIAPPHAPKIPLPAPASPLVVRRGCILSVTLNISCSRSIFGVDTPSRPAHFINKELAPFGGATSFPQD